MYCGENENYVFEDENSELWAVSIPCESNLEKFYEVTPSMIENAKKELIKKQELTEKILFLLMLWITMM